MLDRLQQVMRELPDMLLCPSLWDSLLINRRKPYTYRVFTFLKNGDRICLHKFDPCDDREAFKHPHPWPGAFILLEGSYRMNEWLSKDRDDKNPVHVSEHILERFSQYSITNPLTWHNVIPLSTAYTIMINSPPWPPDVAHTEVRTTAGKDLDKMSQPDLVAHLAHFNHLVHQYLSR